MIVLASEHPGDEASMRALVMKNLDASKPEPFFVGMDGDVPQLVFFYKSRDGDRHKPKVRVAACQETVSQFKTRSAMSV